jgi:serine/threonine protein kinase
MTFPVEIVAELDELCVERERAKGHPQDPGAARRDRRIEELQTRLLEAPQPIRGAIVAGATLETVIRAGNFGTVWRATRVDSGAACAVKVFHRHCAGRGQMLRHFRQSISALRALKDAGAPPSIVQFLEADDSQLAFSMTLVSGSDLSEIARRGWTTDKKMQVFSGVCEAVRFAHQRGILHRGLRPANVLYDETLACPVVTDFDLADVSTLDTTTALYAAPEQRQGSAARLVESDIYSLGRLLQYLITETPPAGPAPSVGEETIARIIATCTREAPAQRYGDVEELQSEVRRWRTGQGVSAARQSTHPPTQIPPQLLPALTSQRSKTSAPWGKLLGWGAALGLLAVLTNFAWDHRLELGWGATAVMPIAAPDAGAPPVKKKPSKPAKRKRPASSESDPSAGFPSDAISRLFVDNNAAFQRCHSDVELPVTARTGQVTTSFQVDARGVLSGARLVATTIKTPAIARCIVAAHNGLRLYKTPGLATSAQSRYEIE